MRQELERLLSNNSLSFLGKNSLLAREQQQQGENSSSRYNNYQEEQANLFGGCPSSCTPKLLLTTKRLAHCAYVIMPLVVKWPMKIYVIELN